MWGFLLCICQTFSPWVNSVTVLNKLIFLEDAVKYYSKQSQPGANFCEWFGACLWHVLESFPGHETARPYSVCSGFQFVVQRSGRLWKAVLILGFVRDLIYDFDQGLIPSRYECSSIKTQMHRGCGETESSRRFWSIPDLGQNPGTLLWLVGRGLSAPADWCINYCQARDTTQLVECLFSMLGTLRHSLALHKLGIYLHIPAIPALGVWRQG